MSTPASALSVPLDLSGHHILLVGGLRQRIAHFKQLVETSNGRFSHHDGGVEESMERLDNLFGRADAVVFPVNCVSHAALGKVKRLCRRWNKPYVPMRRSGIGAFAEALAAVSEVG